MVLSPNTNYGSLVTYACDAGYTNIAGDSIRTCEGDGSWSGAAPTCTQIGTTASHSVIGADIDTFTTFKNTAIINII